MSAMRPLIGVTMDSQEPGGYSKYPWIAQRNHYFDAVLEAGGLPIGLYHKSEPLEQILGMCDGFVLSGGDFDVPPEFYGQEIQHPRVKLQYERSVFEREIALHARQLKKPALGICGGMQIMNVAYGGTLIQHIPDEEGVEIRHEQPNPRTEPGHEILIEPGTPLANIAGDKEESVNSAHHQAVDKLAPGLQLMARATDGVIEAFCDPEQPFSWGVQWHPEMQVTPMNKKIFQLFLQAAIALKKAA